MSVAHASANDEDTLTVGQIVRFELTKRGWNQQKLATELKLSRATVNALINNREAVVSADVAVRLARTFGRAAEFWMRKHFSAADLNDHGGEARTAVAESRPGRLSDGGIRAAILAGQLAVEPFDETLVKPAALDLRVGSEIVTPGGDRIDLGSQAYWLGAKESVLLTTLEKLSVSRGIAGNIGGMARHAKKFIQYGLGFEIDPGFTGHLSFMVTNMGIEPYRLKSGMPIITAMFYRLAEESSTLYENKDISVQERPGALAGNQVGDDIKRAFQERSQTETQPGIYTYRIDGTNFALKVSRDLRGDFDTLFGLYLSEIQAIVKDLKSAASNQEEHERLGRSLELLWSFVGGIAIDREALLSLAPRLRVAFQNPQSEFPGWIDDLKFDRGATPCTLGDQAERLGITPFEFLLLVFKSSGHFRAQF